MAAKPLPPRSAAGRTRRAAQASPARLVAYASGGLLALACLLPAAAQAAPPVIYEKHTVVTFGDDTVEGDLSRPDGQYVESRKRLRHQRLIRVREHFRAELLASVRRL